MIKDVIQLLEDFELENKDHIYPSDLEGFKKWVSDHKDRKVKD